MTAQAHAPLLARPRRAEAPPAASPMRCCCSSRLSPMRGEVTDRGPRKLRAVQARRAAALARLYDNTDPEVMTP